MAKKTIELTSQEDLKIFMSPQRQNLMRNLRISSKPLTSKDMAEILGISTSSAQFHIKKLESLGIVELDHVESINGIQAKYYRMAEVNVNIGSAVEKELSNERYAIMQNLMKGTFDGLLEFYESGASKDEIVENSEFVNGFINLTEQDGKELLKLIREFIETHEKVDEGTQVWEYTLMMYNTKNQKEQGGKNNEK